MVTYVDCDSLTTVVFKHPQGMHISAQNMLSQVKFALIAWFYLFCVLYRAFHNVLRDYKKFIIGEP
jgi:hypothetical protein